MLQSVLWPLFHGQFPTLIYIYSSTLNPKLHFNLTITLTITLNLTYKPITTLNQTFDEISPEAIDASANVFITYTTIYILVLLGIWREEDGHTAQVIHSMVLVDKVDTVKLELDDHRYNLLSFCVAPAEVHKGHQVLLLHTLGTQLDTDIVV